MSTPGRLVVARLAAPLSLACLATFAACAAAAPRATVVARTRAEADSLAASAPSTGRDRALADWAHRASLADLVWLLRRPSAELAGAEVPILDAALSGLPGRHASLRERLLARRALVAPRTGKRGEAVPPPLASARPWASVFRVAAALPDEGEYAGYSRAVRAALATGLASGRASGAPPFSLDTLGTGDSDPGRVAAALEAVVPRSDVVVGELLSVPTQALATGARLAGLALISPTATDERIGRVGPQVFQVGPPAALRARLLAAAVLGREAHRVAIAGSAGAVRGAFAEAFAREVESRGGKVLRRDVLSGGDASRLAGALQGSGADLLFWDGAARDAEALVRALATAGAELRVCGGPSLSPESARPASRVLFEGVTWVDDDWRLPPAERARLDSLAAASGTRPGSLWTRGYLAGRAIAAAVDAGALTASELAAALRARDPALAKDGFLDLAPEGATLPVYVATRGRAVEARATQ